MSEINKISASLQDYLEAIYNIVSEKEGVRSKDIAKCLGVKAGAVTAALRLLARSGYVNYAPYQIITLTEKGCIEAEGIIRLLSFLLVNLA